MSEQQNAGALAEIVREYSCEPTPELDWDAAEERLMRRIDAMPVPRNRSATPWAFGLGGLAAAAAAALFVGWPAPAGEVAGQPAPPTKLTETQANVNGGSLTLGESVVADSQPIRVEHAGRAVWTLAPGSRGHLAVRGRFLTINLESGSVLAEVVPGQAAESFAVEARQTRIATHGTTFRVTLQDAQVKVQVMEGEVVVGSADSRGHTRGYLLAAPGESSFTLGGSHITDRPTPKPEATAQILPPPDEAPTRHTKPKTKPTPPLMRVAQPPPTPQVTTTAIATDKVVENLRKCFVRHTEADGSTHVSAISTLSVTFDEERISHLRFEPRLAPDVERCAIEAAGAIPAPSTPKPEVLKREVWLIR